MTDPKKIIPLLDLKEKALAVHARVFALRLKADANYADVMAFDTKYSESAVEKMDWQEKEKMVAEADILFEATARIEAELAEVDAEYEDIRTQINDYYGKEVLPPIDNHSISDDPADYWKQV